MTRERIKREKGRDKRETGERLKRQERDGAMADGLTYTNKIAGERERYRENRDYCESDGAMSDGLT